MLRFSMLHLLLALWLTACGGASNTQTITMKDMRFREEEVHVKVGRPVTLRVVNQDGYAHAFDIDAFDLHRPLSANEILELTITPEQTGRYRFYCGSPGHEAAGMVGMLIVDE